MAGELEICVKELDSGKETYMMLPWSMGEIYDDLDRCKIFDEYAVYITESSDIPELMNCRFTIPPTLDEICLLAERLVEICKEEEMMYAYRALMRTPATDIYEAINRTYGLESIPVYLCKDAAEYGEIVLENDYLDELSSLPDEIYNLLDHEKVGRLMQASEDGVFMDG